jgi:hypothetical protein
MAKPDIGGAPELDQLLGTLPCPDLDAQRAEVIRRRARAVLANHRRPLGRVRVALGVAYGRVLEPALVSGLAAAYLLWAVRSAALLYGWGG